MMCEGESHGIVWASNKCKAFQKLLAFRIGNCEQYVLMLAVWLTFI